MKTRIGITGKRLGLGGDLLTPGELEQEAEYETRVKDSAFDLLDALKAIVELAPRNKLKLPYAIQVVEIADAAIAKAEGLSPDSTNTNGGKRKP